MQKNFEKRFRTKTFFRNVFGQKKIFEKHFWTKKPVSGQKKTFPDKNVFRFWLKILCSSATFLANTWKIYFRGDFANFNDQNCHTTFRPSENQSRTFWIQSENEFHQNNFCDIFWKKRMELQEFFQSRNWYPECEFRNSMFVGKTSDPRYWLGVGSDRDELESPVFSSFTGVPCSGCVCPVW